MVIREKVYGKFTGLYRDKKMTKRNLKQSIKRLKKALARQELDLLYWNQCVGALTHWSYKKRLEKVIDFNHKKLDELKYEISQLHKPKKRSKRRIKYDRSYR